VQGLLSQQQQTSSAASARPPVSTPPASPLVHRNRSANVADVSNQSESGTRNKSHSMNPKSNQKCAVMLRGDAAKQLRSQGEMRKC
jgi:hypothetical protein